MELLDDRVIANGAGGALPPPPPPPQETTKNITINILYSTLILMLLKESICAIKSLSRFTFFSL